MWRYLKSKIRGRSPTAKKALPDSSEQSGPQEEPEEPGLIQLNDDQATEDGSYSETYEVDIVAIQGLNGTPFGTWTHENKTFWLKDLLAKDVRGARIFTYKYPSHVLFSKSKATTEEYAKSLLVNLKDNRNGVGQDRRRIIFIAHSLGGIVCKQALIIANQDPTFALLLERTEGIIFFGTPHRGARTSADIGVFFFDIAQAALSVSGTRLLLGGTRNDLVRNLRANAPDLRRIIESFRHLLSKVQIVSVYETEDQVPLGRLIVDQDSATLGIEREKTIPRYKCHTEICRYSGPSDPAYRTILGAISDLCKTSSSVDPMEESEKARIGLFNRFDVKKYRSDLSQHLDGTCEWVLKSSQYQQWAQETRSSLLWISGHVGSGKTTLSSYIAKVLGDEQPSSKEISRLCYFFCDKNGTEQQRDAKGILCSIIFQILMKRRYLFRHVETALEYDKNGNQLLQSYDRLWSIFETIIRDDRIGHLHVIIDALDECEEPGRKRMMEGIARLVETLRPVPTRCIKFLFTSRPEVKLTEYFDAYQPQRLRLEDRKDEIDDDLHKVIEQRMTEIANKTQAKPDDVEELKRFLTEHADQSFLWVKLTLDILDGELSTAIQDFPSILAGVPRRYQATYRRLLHDIPPNWKSFARKSLYLIMASYRPLSLEEINILISTQEMTLEECHSIPRKAKQHLHPNIEMDINRVLGSLVRISDSMVYLVHISLKEYLCPSVNDDLEIHNPGPDLIDMCQANLFLASACMAYLSLPEFQEDIFANEISHEGTVSLLPSGQSIKGLECGYNGEISANLQLNNRSIEGYKHGLEHQQQKKQEKRLKFARIDAELRASVVDRYALFEYAAIYWAEHFAQIQDLAGKNLQDLALSLSDYRLQHIFFNWFRYFWATCTRYPSNEPVICDRLAVAGFLGHHTSLSTIIGSADFISIGNPANALYWASRNGHERCVMRLLQTNLNPNSCIVYDQSALCSAANNGHLSIVKALATDHRVNINFTGAFGHTPLSFAAINGHTEMVEFLLSQEHVDPNATNMVGDPPVICAFNHGHFEEARILIADDRVNLDHPVERLFMLTTEAENDRVEEIVPFLLEQPRFDANRPLILGRTTLADAAMKGNTARIEQLSWRGINNSHSHNHKDGRSAISLAAGGGHNEAIKLLHETFGVPGIDEEDEEGKTALFWALLNHRNSTVEYLLQSKCVIVNHRDHHGRTALSWAVRCGNEVGLRLLLEAKEIRPLIKDNEGLTPLDLARRLEDSARIASIIEEYLLHKG